MTIMLDKYIAFREPFSLPISVAMDIEKTGSLI